jgi:hypothetical protein
VAPCQRRNGATVAPLLCYGVCIGIQGTISCDEKEKDKRTP